MIVKTYANRMEMGMAAATAVAVKIRQLLTTQQEVNIIFAAAPSQNEFLESLINEEKIDWSHVNAFHMDEYIGLPADAPQSFGNFLKYRLFHRLPFRSINYIRGESPDDACATYTALLQQHPADIVCMGIGENGHLAFNDPPVADFMDPQKVKIVELDQVCRQQQVNDGCFETLSQVPTHAITLTIPALLEAADIFCIVPGQQKAQAVYNTIHQDIQEQYPSSILRSHAGTILFLDAQSSSLL